jgi:HPr kinase/phosphorylase
MNIHATTVVVNGHAVVIMGRSGSGKSALALQLIAMGAMLVADDQTLIDVQDGELWASRPQSLPNKIEARGIGLLTVKMGARSKIALTIDLDTSQTDRLPQPDTITIHGQKITVWRKVEGPHFPAAILVYLSNMSDAAKQID